MTVRCGTESDYRAAQALANKTNGSGRVGAMSKRRRAKKEAELTALMGELPPGYLNPGRFKTPIQKARTKAKAKLWQQSPDGRAYAKEASLRRRNGPKWDKDAVNAIKQRAKQQGLTTDHIFSIKAVDQQTKRRASGLHRSWNLQLLTQRANAKKRNHVDLEQEAQRLMDHAKKLGY